MMKLTTEQVEQRNAKMDARFAALKKTDKDTLVQIATRHARVNGLKGEPKMTSVYFIMEAEYGLRAIRIWDAARNG